jgi:hypothetical protein
MKASEVEAWSGYQSHQADHAIQRFEQDVGGAVCVGGFELIAYLSVAGQ